MIGRTSQNSSNKDNETLSVHEKEIIFISGWKNDETYDNHKTRKSIVLLQPVEPVNAMARGYNNQKGRISIYARFTLEIPIFLENRYGEKKNVVCAIIFITSESGKSTFTNFIPPLKI